MTARDIDAPDLTDDAFLGGALRLLQPERGYRAGVDAVLLAAAVPAMDGRQERVLDAGAGVGAAGLCLARRIFDAQVVLVEREPSLVKIARENILRNGLAERARAVAADVTARALEGPGLGLEPNSFHHTLANPPFHAEGRGTPSRSALKSAAHAMERDDLARWARFLARMAAPGGTVTLIHKPEALGELLAAFGGRFGGLRIVPIYPRAGLPAIRVLARGVKGSRAPLVIEAGLVLHGDGEGFTQEAEAILRRGLALDSVRLPLDGGRAS